MTWDLVVLGFGLVFGFFAGLGAGNTKAKGDTEIIRKLTEQNKFLRIQRAELNKVVMKEPRKRRVNIKNPNVHTARESYIVNIAKVREVYPDAKPSDLHKVVRHECTNYDKIIASDGKKAASNMLIESIRKFCIDDEILKENERWFGLLQKDKVI